MPVAVGITNTMWSSDVCVRMMCSRMLNGVLWIGKQRRTERAGATWTVSADPHLIRCLTMIDVIVNAEQKYN